MYGGFLKDCMDKRPRLIIEVPIEIHNAIKAEAKKRNLSMRKYMLKSIMASLMYINQHQAKP